MKKSKENIDPFEIYREEEDMLVAISYAHDVSLTCQENIYVFPVEEGKFVITNDSMQRCDRNPLAIVFNGTMVKE